MATSLKLDDAMKTRVKNLATARDRSAHWVMREAIREYVEREEKRESFRQSALRAWKNHQSTGLHVTAEEADVWLSRLADGEDVDPPHCHG